MRLAIALLLSLVALSGCQCGSSDVGNSCIDDSECASGTCYVGPGGGYCTALCAEEGDVAGCPADTVCKPIHGGPRRCLLICETNGDCPNGSQCTTVSNSDFKGCEPL